MKYAHLFTDNTQTVQNETNDSLVWKGLDWDIRTRSALVIGLLDVSSAQVLQSLPPVTDATSLNAVKDAVAILRPKLRDMGAQIQTNTGWTLQLPKAALIAGTLCDAAWLVFKGSGHGKAWITANALHPELKAILAAADVSPLARLAARAVTWQAGAASAIANIDTFDPNVVRAALSLQVAPIIAAHAAFLKTL